MTNEERDLISQFVARVGGNAGGGFSRSVPTTQPALPPIDPEADRFIAEQFASHPEARYRITQMAVVQEAALAEAASRMQSMQAELEAARQQMQQMQQSAPPQGQNKGFFGGLFGSGQQSAPSAPRPSPWNQGGPAQPQYAPPPSAYAPPQAAYPPQYPPNVQPGMFQRSGSGFLGSALGTAAGVAGGVVAGNLLMDMFSGNHGGMGSGFGGAGLGGAGFGGMPVQNETIINNYGDAAGGAQPADWDNSAQGGGGDPGWSDSSQGGGFDDSSQGGGGFDDNSPVSGVWAEFETHVRPEWLDGNGHMNLAYYVLVFDRGTDEWLELAGLGATYRQDARRSVFAVETHTLYRQEVRADALLQVRTRAASAMGKRIHLLHEMQSGGMPVCMQEVLFLHVDLITRRAAPLDPAAAARVAALLPPPGLGLPDWAGRRIGERPGDR